MTFWFLWGVFQTDIHNRGDPRSRFLHISAVSLHLSGLFFRNRIQSSCFGGTSCCDAPCFRYKSGRFSRTFVCLFASSENFPTMVQQPSKPGAKDAHLLKAGHPPAGKLLSSHSCMRDLCFYKLKYLEGGRTAAFAARFQTHLCAHARWIKSAAALGRRSNTSDVFKAFG